MARLSPRLMTIVDALPLSSGMRVLEIGCGTGAALREVASRIGNGYALGIDRSDKAIRQAEAASRPEIALRRISFRHVAAEDFELEKGELPFDLAFAVRVGALDGRYPELGKVALSKIRGALKKSGRIFVSRANTLREL